MTKEECEIETSKAIMEMRNHIAELEKENAELNKKLSKAEADYDEMFWNKNEIISEAKTHIHRLLVLLTEGKQLYTVIDEARAFMKED